MAQAVKELWPQVQLGIGPSIEDGFYYDFDLPRTLTADDLDEISDRMKLIIKEDKDLALKRAEVRQLEEENKRLRVFYNHLAAYDYQLIRYMTLLADRPPFPFNDLPAPWDEVPEEVDLDGR